MAFVLADRVQETTATAGTGALALAGSAAGFRAFSAVMATGDTTRYTVVDEATGAWETGLGTFTAGTPPTLSRAPAASSAGGAAVSLAGNASARVFISPDAGYFATLAPRTNPAITGGTIDGASIGATTAGTGRFTTLAATDGAASVDAGSNPYGAALALSSRGAASAADININLLTRSSGPGDALGSASSKGWAFVARSDANAAGQAAEDGEHLRHNHPVTGAKGRRGRTGQCASGQCAALGTEGH